LLAILPDAAIYAGGYGRQSSDLHRSQHVIKRPMIQPAQFNVVAQSLVEEIDGKTRWPFGLLFSSWWRESSPPLLQNKHVHPFGWRWPRQCPIKARCRNLKRYFRKVNEKVSKKASTAKLLGAKLLKPHFIIKQVKILIEKMI